MTCKGKKVILKKKILTSCIRELQTFQMGRDDGNGVSPGGESVQYQGSFQNEMILIRTTYPLKKTTKMKVGEMKSK